MKPSPDPYKQILMQRMESEIKYRQEGLEIIKNLAAEPSPDPLNMLKIISKPDPTPWKAIGSVASHIPEAQLKQIMMQVVESEMKYMQTGLEIIENLAAMPGPFPWNMSEIILKPSPDPWKAIGSVASHIPKAQLKQIVMQGMESEIKYMQAGLTIRRLIYDGLKEKKPSED